MAEFLFTTDADMKSTTLMGGNLDPDKYKFTISNAMDSVIEPLLGSELFNVISAGAEAANLTGLYLELYNDFVKPITKNAGLSGYLKIASIELNNAGLFKRQPENSIALEDGEIDHISQLYMRKADKDIGRFYKWIGLNPLTEYKISQDRVDSQKIEPSSGWYFGE
tara:strand:- start:135 stop:632 length:498 start_codon:yes stop_codon:yes gene_type:complete